jgi:subtilisin family serine protease
MAAPDHDRHLRPGHPYPTLPPGIRICDDEHAGGDFFFYRDGQLVVHIEDQRRVRDLLTVLGYEQDRHYHATRSSVNRPFALLEFEGQIDTIDVFRALRYDGIGDDPGTEREAGTGTDHGPHTATGVEQPEPDSPQVWLNQVAHVQYHTGWGAGTPPYPRGPLSRLPAGDNLPGTGVRVGVLDTGIENQDWLDGRWSEAAGRSRTEVTDDSGDAPTLRYQAGHGSFVAGTILQHAPGAQLVVDRLDDVAGCIDDWALHKRLSAMLDPENQLDVLNLSLGGYTAGRRPLPCVGSVLTDALDARPELVVVASAGNDGTDRTMWPAAMARVIGVGAIGADGDRWPQSNFGEWVNAWSLGEDLASTFLRWPRAQSPHRYGDLEPGPHYPFPPPQAQRFEGWATWSGTSFAAARVSGAIAAELKRDGRSARRVVFDLVESAAHGFESGGLVTPATYAT